MEAIIYPELALAAMRQKRDRELRLWTLLRAFDEGGSGNVSRADFCEWLAGLGLKGLSEQSTRALLAKGEGAFWTCTKDRIYLTGLYQLCRALDVYCLKSERVSVGIAKLKTLKSWRAACFASRFPADKFSRPISRKTLQQLTGRTAPTQIGYARAARMETRQNAALTHKGTGGEREKGEFVALIAGRPAVLRRMPNSYRSHLQTCGRGNQGRKAHKALSDARRDSGAGQFTPLYLEGRKLAARTSRRIQRAVASDREDAFFVSLGDDPHNGCLWAHYVVMDGLVLIA